MSQPTPYNRATSFTNAFASNPTQVFPGASLDTELNNAKITLDQVLANLALIQKDDGTIANGVIGPAQLSSQITTGFTAPTVWQTGVKYTTSPVSTVFHGTAYYTCQVSHTSGVFATDLAAGDWLLVVDFVSLPLTTATQVAVTPAGTITQVNVQTALQQLDSLKQATATLTSTSITDATALGRSLLTAANAAAGVALLGSLSGPASSTTGHLAAFADGTGQVLKDGGPGFEPGAVVMKYVENAWKVYAPDGSSVSTVGTTTSGLQEAITYAVNNGNPLEVYGHGSTQITVQNGTLNATKTVTSLTSTTTISAAMSAGSVYVTGVGIPAGTIVTSVDSSTQIKISLTATASGVKNLTFSQNAVFISCTSGIQVPPAEQWSASFKDVNITFSSAVTGPCFSFDSCMIVDFSFVGGQIVGTPNVPGGAAYLIYFNPTLPVPLDGVTVITASRFFFSNLAYPATGGTAVGVVGWNTSTGSVNNSFFGFCEVNGTGTGAVPNTTFGMVVFGPGATTGFEQNIIDCAVVHECASAGIQIGTAATNQANLRQNQWRIGAIKTGTGSDGFNSYGSADIVHIGGITNEEGTEARGVVLEAGALANHVTVGAIQGNSGATLTDGGSGNFCYGSLRGGSIGATKGHVIAPDGTITAYINNAAASAGGTVTTFSVTFTTLLSVVAVPQNSVIAIQCAGTTTGVTLTSASGSSVCSVIAVGR